MSLRDYLCTDTTTITAAQAERLRTGPSDHYTIEVTPPAHDDVPATLDGFVRGITDYHTTWLGCRNASPIVAYEIRRVAPNEIRFQFSVPTKRLERRVRTNLVGDIPRIGFDTGESGIPVSEGDTIGGGILTLGRPDWSPLETTFDEPPLNRVAGTLHRHAMRDTRFVVQILFQPWVGQPLRSWYWTRRASQRISSLKQEKEKLWGTRPPTRREKRHADAIEAKARAPKYTVSIRVVIIGAGEYTRSRLTELASGFNIFECPDTGQYLTPTPVTSLWDRRLLGFAQEVADRRLGNWTLPFHVSEAELASLVSIPDRQQRNIQQAQP